MNESMQKVSRYQVLQVGFEATSYNIRHKDEWLYLIDRDRLLPIA